MTDQNKGLEAREEIARIILGPTSHWNGHGRSLGSLEEWPQYPETGRALAKADAILAITSQDLADAKAEIERLRKTNAELNAALAECNQLFPIRLNRNPTKADPQ